MLVNSSSSNSSSSSNFYYPPCNDVFVTRSMFLAFLIVDIFLLLPLSVYVLVLGFQRWKQQQPTAAASLSDFVTYNMALMELVGIFGYSISLCGGISGCPMMMWVGNFIGGFPWYGQMLFLILTCVERYLAVVHPITYLRLRQMEGVRIRNISSGFVWIQCFIGVGLLILFFNFPDYSLIPSTLILSVFLVGVTFSSLSVLCILIRPRPGESCGHRVRVDQSKKRVFRTIMIITIVLLLRFGGNLICTVVGFSPKVSYSVQCVAMSSTAWVNLPSSLVLPLLFLHKAGKLPGCKHNTEPA